MTDPLRLLRGTLDVVILRTLEAGPRHGYDIVSALADRSEGALQVEDGALYQSLHRMRERGWVRSEWGHAQSGKRARFYELTPRGRKELQRASREWLDYSDAILKILRP